MSIRSDADPVGELGIAQAGGVEPVVGEGLEVAGDPIGSPHVGVGEDRDVAGVVMGEEREQEMTDGVVAEVGREKADRARCGRGCGRYRGVGSGAASGAAWWLAQRRCSARRAWASCSGW